MKIETKFNEGDSVFTIDTSTLKVKNFKVDHIGTYTSNGKTTVTLYDGSSVVGKGYEETKCFRTEAELIAYVTAKEDAKAI